MTSIDQNDTNKVIEVTLRRCRGYEQNWSRDYEQKVWRFRAELVARLRAEGVKIPNRIGCDRFGNQTRKGKSGKERKRKRK